MLDVIVEAPTKDELEEDAYQAEYELSGLSQEGRSDICGY